MEKNDTVIRLYDVRSCLCCIMLPLHVTVKTEWQRMAGISRKAVKRQWRWTTPSKNCPLSYLSQPHSPNASTGLKTWDPINIWAKLKAAMEWKYVVGRKKRWENRCEEKEREKRLWEKRVMVKEDHLQTELRLIHSLCQHLSATGAFWIL